MYIFFGVDGEYNVLSDIWSYDPSANTWQQEPSGGTTTPPVRFLHTSMCIPDGRILTFGGYGSDFNLTEPSLWSYTPGSGTWEQKAASSFGARGGASAAVFAGKMYVFGGTTKEGYSNDMLVYDPGQNSWEKLTISGSIPEARTACAGAYSGDLFWIYGGVYEVRSGDLKDTWEFNAANNTWTQRTDMPVALSGAKAVAFQSQGRDTLTVTVLMFGGTSGGVPVDKTYGYIPRGDIPIDSIKIVNQTNNEVGTLTMRAGETLPLFALGYCGTTTVGYLAVTWSIEGDLIGTLSPTTGTNTLFTAITIGSGTIKAVITGGTITDMTGTITVTGGTVTSITISPATKTLTADEFATYTATAQDAQNNLWDVSEETTWITTDPKGTFTVNVYNPGQAGNWMITGKYNGLEGTAAVTVIPGALNYVRIEDSGGNEIINYSMPTDGSLTLYCRGYDADNNLIGDVSGSWTVTPGNLGDVAPQAGTKTTFDARKVGTGTIKVDDGAGHSDTTDVITVGVGALNYVRIEDQGGNPIGTQSMTTDETLDLYCRGYDGDDNLIGDVTGTWTVNGDIGTVSPAVGTKTTFDARKVGTGTIKVDNGAGHSDTTDVITVSAALNYVRIEDQAGNPIGTQSMTTDETLDLYYRGYDGDNNSIGYLSGTWTVTNNIGNVIPQVGTRTIFYATNVGIGTIRVEGAGTVAETGLITVNLGFETTLEKAFVYPNPYYASGKGHTYIYFDKLTSDSIIQIFTIAGELVREIPVTKSRQDWDVRNSDGEKVASGVYIYLIKDPAGNKKVGKLGILR
ncbi:MAG: kelch repeat-containing protein [bacterium]